MNMFQVIDNNKPADCNNYKVDKSWNKSKFETLDEAFLRHYWPVKD